MSRANNAETGTGSRWKPGFRHQVREDGDDWRCVDCGERFEGTWPSDGIACPGPSEATTGDAVTYEVGQIVWVFGVNHREPFQREVVKVGRQLVYVENGRQRPMTFDKVTGVERGPYNHYFIKSDAEKDLDDRRRAAKEALRVVGLVVDRLSPLTLEQLESVAALVSS